MGPVFVKISTIMAIAAISPVTATVDLELDDFATNGTILSICGSLLLLATFGSLTQKCRVQTIRFALLLIYGMIWGAFNLGCKEFSAYSYIIYINPRNVLFAYMPVLIFYISFSLDVHIFLKSLAQIAIISFPMNLIYILVVGFVMRIIIEPSWSVGVAVLFGSLCSTIYANDVVIELHKLGPHTKHISTLLEGETVLGAELMALVFALCANNLMGFVVRWYQFIALTLRYILIAVPTGYILGLVSTLLIRRMGNDRIGTIVIMLATPFIAFYISEMVVATSGVICVMVIGILMSLERTPLSSEMDDLTSTFWNLATNVLNSVVCLIAGAIFSSHVIPYMETRDYLLILVNFLVCCLVRFLCFLFYGPMLSRIGYGLTFRETLIISVCQLRNPLVLAMAIRLHAVLGEDYFKITYLIMMHVIGLFLLGYLVSGLILYFGLKRSKLGDITMAKQINMTNCVKFVLIRREKAIAILKMDRFLADVHWPIVKTETMIQHPYKVKMTSQEEEQNFMGYRFTRCPDCKKDILNEPSKKEFHEMTREARMRILKAKKISFGRQYENGMLSKEGFRTLSQTVDLAMDSKLALIELDELENLFKKEVCVVRCWNNYLHKLIKPAPLADRPPRRYWRRLCYHLEPKIGFTIVIYTTVIISVINIILENVLMPPRGSSMWYIFFGIDSVIVTVYSLEFIVKLLARSWIYVWKHGVCAYFSSGWNIFDFIILCATILDLSVDIGYIFTYAIPEKYALGIVIFKLILAFRLLRLLSITHQFHNALLKRCELKMDRHMAYAYELGKAYVTAEEEVMEMLPYMIDNENIRMDMNRRMQEDRFLVTKLLGLVQKDKPWISITVKTKQAIRTVLNNMKDAFYELKFSGWVDEVEFAKLMDSLQIQYKFVGSIRTVQPSAPKVVFKEVSWMGDEENIINFLYQNVITKKFDPKDIVCVEGKVADGIYVVVTGLLLMCYTPKANTLENLKIGCLPIVDYVSAPKFEEPSMEYIVSGNCVGELSTLTGRPYDCTVTADTHCQVYFLSRDIIKQAMSMDPDPVNGLECRIWRAVSIRIAIVVLMDVPAYELSNQNQIKFTLERAFMPNFSNFKAFIVNETVQDIILIEGTVTDSQSNQVFVGPCYITRNVKKLIFPKTSDPELSSKVITKLLLVPAKEVDEYDIMAEALDECELVMSESQRCLTHFVETKMSKASASSRRLKHLFQKRKRKMVGQSQATLRSYPSSVEMTMHFLNKNGENVDIDDNTSYSDK